MPWLPPFYRLSSILPPPSNLHGSKIKQIHFENAFTPIQRQKMCTIQSKSPIFPCIFVVCLYYQLTVTNTLQQQRQMLHSLRSHVQHLKFASRAGINGGSTDGGYSDKNGVANDGGSSIVLPSGSSFLGSTVLLHWSSCLVMARQTSPASLLPADTFG